MRIRLSIDVFSGRPNPAVELAGTLAAEALRRSRPITAGRASGGGDPPELGYRGILFEQLDRADPELPRTFRLADGIVSAARGFAARPVDDGFEDELLEWFASLTSEWAGLAAYAEEQKARRTQDGRGAAPGHEVRLDRTARTELRRGCGGAPEPDAEWWNASQLQLWNNCYNYAGNYRTDSFAQPGRASASLFRSLVSAEVVRAALADQLTWSAQAENQCPPEGHLVALVLAPGFDFHWYRKGRNGFWSHKVGPAGVSLYDNSGRTIADPRTADRGPYTEFSGFFVVVEGHIKIV